MVRVCTFSRSAIWAAILAATLATGAPGVDSSQPDDYFPPPESAGGWRKLSEPDDVRQIAGMDAAKLDTLKEWLLRSDNRDFAAVVIRRGHIVLEVERGNSAKTDDRRVASVSKAVCATVLAIAAERSRQGLTPKNMTFDDPAFDFIPQAQPLSDPRKAQITVRQLLNHTSGITPEATGARNQGPWQHVLGHDGDPLTAQLAFDPGTKCGYSSFALYHASLVCENVTGVPYDRFAIETLFKPIGVEHWTFEYFDDGGPDGDVRYGRHPSHGLGMPARDLARIGYCMLREGRWREKQVVPKWFVDETAAPTHNVKEPELRFNRAAESFSHGWELPARLTDGRGKGIPPDARFKPGSGGQLLAFVPSLDLVVTRQTGSSGNWDYEEYLRLACDAVEKDAQPDPSWRTLPLVSEGAIDSCWKHLWGGGFSVMKDGSLRTDCSDAGMGLLLFTKERFGDCQIRVVYRSDDAKSNAGVYVRIDDGILERAGDPLPLRERDSKGKLTKETLERIERSSEGEREAWYPVHHGYEVQICDTGDEYHRTGAVYSLAPAAPAPEKTPAEWKTMIITLKGNLILVDVDGKRLTTFDPDSPTVPPRKRWSEPRREPKRPLAGFIGLQNHDPGDVVYYREVSVRPLGTAKESPEPQTN